MYVYEGGESTSGAFASLKYMLAGGERQLEKTETNMEEEKRGDGMTAGERGSPRMYTIKSPKERRQPPVG